ncbi:MAG: GTPase ObgE [Candidatus Hydrogenedentes bacterium]|nr:GTPase ObgE [Candidatus Hydrogenedentota bacterium]
MLVDRARVKVVAGAGGNGCCAFRREKYVPRGGPSGGDGGDGGSVFFVADEQLTSLLDVKYHSFWKGERGQHGMGSDCHGWTGEDALVRLPVGTIVRDFKTQTQLADLVEPGQRFLAARGGRGGKGNARFVTSTNRAPRFAELGEPGEEREYLLELKVIAEVGVVGLPNAGKSTLLAASTAAHPKIDSYPFTTLSPNLGVAMLSDHRTLTLADIPGIIEGAAQGKGLGHDFLRHIERTKVLLFLIDLGDEDPVQTRDILENELAQHSPVFAERPRVYVLNKADVPENRARFDVLESAFGTARCISAVTGEGVEALLEELWALVERLRREPEPAQLEADETEYTYEAPFTIERMPNGFRIEGKRAMQAAQMTAFDNDSAVRHFHNRLKRMGLFHALKRMGAEEGQTIAIGDVEFEYHPD